MSAREKAAAAPRPRFEPRPATDAEARALASGLRLRILRMCLDESLTNREIAETLGRNPASVLHHVRTLVDTGYLEAQEPRRGRRGAREIPYRTTGKSWYTYDDRAGSSLLDAFLAELEQVPAEQQGITRLGLRLPPEEMTEFRQRLNALLQEFHDRGRSPAAEAWSVFIAVHPDTSQRRRPGETEPAIEPGEGPGSEAGETSGPGEHVP